MSVLQDVRYGLRVLLKSPGATLVMLLILGLGIGANTAIFNFVDALYLKPLAVEDPDRLVKVFAKGPHGHYGAGFSYPEYASLRDNTTSFTNLAAETGVAQLHVIFGKDVREMQAAFVSANYFSTLGVRPLLGRFFLGEEDAVPDRDPVAVISAELWKSEFHNDPSVIGSSINVNRMAMQIIGVAPPDFHGARAGHPQQLWMPLMMLHAGRYFGTCPHAFDCSVVDDLIGRLAEGRSRRDAADESERIVVWSASDWPAGAGRRDLVTFSATGVDPDERAEFNGQMRLLMGVAIVLLLLSCMNLAGLFLARSLSRAQEVAVRLSIGASRARLARQLLTESLLLSLLSAVPGLIFAVWGTNLLAGFYGMDSEGFSHMYDLRMDWRALAFSLVLSLTSGVLFGLAPALRATRQDLITYLKKAVGTSQARGWLRQGLVAAQVAVSLALLVSAGLLTRSSGALRSGTNFDPAHVAVLRVRPELLNYSSQQNEEFFQRVVQHFKELPGVEAVTYVRGGEGLVWDWASGRDVSVALAGQSSESARVRHHDIGLNFFSTLRIPLIEGRDFTENDSVNAPAVAILNQTLARRLWPDSSASGRSILVNGKPVQVVGVAADIQPRNSLKPSAPYLFLPFWQSDPGKEGDMRLAIRVKGDPVTSLPELRRAVHRIDAGIPIGEDMSMLQQIEAEYMPVMLLRTVVSYSGAVALSLSGIGLFSVLTYYVKTRVREIGIRMALGAQMGSVLRLVIGQGLAMSLTGVAAGLFLAVGSTRLLAAWLYGTGVAGFSSFVMAALLLLIVAVAASYFPARRAAEVDPMIALRQE